MRSGLLLLILCLLISVAFAQSSFTVNQKVEVEWKGTWYKATILEIKGSSYKIHYDGYGASWDELVPASRIRSASANPEKTAGASGNTGTTAVKHGKYGCTASKYVNGFYEYMPKGSFVLSKNGTYTYNGFTKPSKGTYKLEANKVIAFKGGYFNGGQATPIEGTENRYYLVFPTNPDNRWTCGLISEE